MYTGMLHVHPGTPLALTGDNLTSDVHTLFLPGRRLDSLVCSVETPPLTYSGGKRRGEEQDGLVEGRWGGSGCSSGHDVELFEVKIKNRKIQVWIPVPSFSSLFPRCNLYPLKPLTCSCVM